MGGWVLPDVGADDLMKVVFTTPPWRNRRSGSFLEPKRSILVAVFKRQLLGECHAHIL